VKKKPSVIRHYMEYAGLRMICVLLRLVPAELCFQAARLLGPALAILAPLRKKVVLENLRRAFPDEDSQSLGRLVRETYRHFLYFGLEFIFLTRWSGEETARRISAVDGMEHLEQAKSTGRPFLVVTGHMGNWEMMGSYFADKGYDLSVLAKPMHNPLTDRYINAARRKAGMEVIPTGDNVIRDVLSAVKRKRHVVFLADQDARRAGIFVPFLGTQASTFTGPALFSVRTGCPILPVYDIWEGPGRHRIIFLPPVYPPEKPADRDSAVRGLTEAHVRGLEEMVRRYPSQYFWFHRRWKTQPK